MSDMKVVDLSEAQEHVAESSDTPSYEELQEHELGEIVSVEGEGDGIVAARVDKAFTWPTDLSKDEAKKKAEESEHIKKVTDEGNLEMKPAGDEPLYVVALQDGGSVVATANEIDSSGSIEGKGKEIESWDEVKKDADEAELAEIYGRVENPSDYTEFMQEKARMIHERQAAELADYVEGRDMNVSELEDYSVEELLNIPGVDDPEVGFASDPDGWTRKSYLQAWASLGGMWRTCYPRMIREFGPNRAKRWCAAMKDEVLQTEEWRGDF